MTNISITYKGIALGISILFGLEQLAMAAPVASVQVVQATPFPSAQDIIQNPSRIDIPFEYGTLKEVHKGTNGKLIIHIQDAHANLSGQKNLAKILDKLMGEYDINTVLLEGGDRDVTLDAVKKITDKKTWKIIANKFLFESIITGAEYLNLTSDHPMKLIGIEYPDLYESNLRAYAKLVEQRKQTLNYLHKIKISLNRIKNKLYPKEVLQFEEHKQNSKTQNNDFLENFEELLNLVQKTPIDIAQDFPEVHNLNKLKNKEKYINFEEANKEQASLFRELTNRGQKEQVQIFIKSSQASKNSQMSQSALMQSIMSLATANSINLMQYPNFKRYSKYLSEFSDLKMNVLLEELESIEDIIYRDLLPDNDIKKVRAIDRYLGLLEKAYTIQMSSREFEMFQLNEPIFETQKWQTFLNEKLEQLDYEENRIQYQPYLENANKDTKEFYALVSQRDQGFLEIAQKNFEEQNNNTAFLIAGGYHTENITKLLREEDYSYVVITPIVTHETDHKKYEENLLKPLTLLTSDASIANLKPNQRKFSATKLNQVALGSRLASVNDGQISDLLEPYGLRERFSGALGVIRLGKPNSAPIGTRMAGEKRVRVAVHEYVDAIPFVMTYLERFVDYAQKQRGDADGNYFASDDRTGDEVAYILNAIDETPREFDISAGLINLDEIKLKIRADLLNKRIEFGASNIKNNMSIVAQTILLWDKQGTHFETDVPVYIDYSEDLVDILAVYLYIESGTYLKLELIRGDGSDEVVMDARDKVSAILDSYGNPAQRIKTRATIVRDIQPGTFEVKEGEPGRARMANIVEGPDGDIDWNEFDEGESKMSEDVREEFDRYFEEYIAWQPDSDSGEEWTKEAKLFVDEIWYLGHVFWMLRHASDPKLDLRADEAEKLFQELYFAIDNYSTIIMDSYSDEMTLEIWWALYAHILIIEHELSSIDEPTPLVEEHLRLIESILKTNLYRHNAMVTDALINILDQNFYEFIQDHLLILVRLQPSLRSGVSRLLTDWNELIELGEYETYDSGEYEESNPDFDEALQAMFGAVPEEAAETEELNNKLLEVRGVITPTNEQAEHVWDHSTGHIVQLAQDAQVVYLDTASETNVEYQTSTAELPHRWKFRLGLIEELALEGYEKIGFASTIWYIKPLLKAFTRKGDQPAVFDLEKILQSYLNNNNEIDIREYLSLPNNKEEAPEVTGTLNYWKQLRDLKIKYRLDITLMGQLEREEPVKTKNGWENVYQKLIDWNVQSLGVKRLVIGALVDKDNPDEEKVDVFGDFDDKSIVRIQQNNARGDYNNKNFSFEVAMNYSATQIAESIGWGDYESAAISLDPNQPVYAYLSGLQPSDFSDEDGMMGAYWERQINFWKRYPRRFKTVVIVSENDGRDDEEEIVEPSTYTDDLNFDPKDSFDDSSLVETSGGPTDIGRSRLSDLEAEIIKKFRDEVLGFLDPITEVSLSAELAVAFEELVNKWNWAGELSEKALVLDDWIDSILDLDPREMIEHIGSIVDDRYDIDKISMDVMQATLAADIDSYFIESSHWVNFEREYIESFVRERYQSRPELLNLMQELDYQFRGFNINDANRRIFFVDWMTDIFEPQFFKSTYDQVLGKLKFDEFEFEDEKFDRIVRITREMWSMQFKLGEEWDSLSELLIKEFNKVVNTSYIRHGRDSKDLGLIMAFADMFIPERMMNDTLIKLTRSKIFNANYPLATATYLETLKDRSISPSELPQFLSMGPVDISWPTLPMTYDELRDIVAYSGERGFEVIKLGSSTLILITTGSIDLSEKQSQAVGFGAEVSATFTSEFTLAIGHSHPIRSTITPSLDDLIVRNESIRLPDFVTMVDSNGDLQLNYAEPHQEYKLVDSSQVATIFEQLGIIKPNDESTRMAGRQLNDLGIFTSLGYKTAGLSLDEIWTAEVNHGGLGSEFVVPDFGEGVDNVKLDINFVSAEVRSLFESLGKDKRVAISNSAPKNLIVSEAFIKLIVEDAKLVGQVRDMLEYLRDETDIPLVGIDVDATSPLYAELRNRGFGQFLLSGIAGVRLDTYEALSQNTTLARTGFHVAANGDQLGVNDLDARLHEITIAALKAL
ncbi:MAG: hypothetical protein ACI9Y8_001872, partial [Candidatus Omnitrophota bacterium]